MKYIAIVFDFNGVIFGNPGFEFDRKISKVIGVSVKDFKTVYRRYNNSFNIGLTSLEKLWSDILSDFNKTSLLPEVLELVNSPRVINQNVISIIKNLKEKGYRLGIFSNFTKSGAQFIKNNSLITSLFDTIVISSEIALAKPNHDAYKYLINKLDLPPQEIIFIDDSQINIDAAENIGIKSILFKNSPILKKQLSKIGIL